MIVVGVALAALEGRAGGRLILCGLGVRWLNVPELWLRALPRERELGGLNSGGGGLGGSGLFTSGELDARDEGDGRPLDNT